MFTVKATYRNETRKFSFPDSSFFPTYHQLYNQLYRVFPLSHNYYLSKLLFSPDSSKPPRILIGKEVHSADEFDACIAPFRGRAWPNSLLKFHIFDETPHKRPSVVASEHPKSWSQTGDSDSTHHQTLGSNTRRSPPPQPTVSPFHVPPPPIIFSSPPSQGSQAPMDIDAADSTNSRTWPDINGIWTSPPQQEPQQQTTPKQQFCCSIAEGKAEVQTLLNAFKQDLDRTLTNTFGLTPIPLQPPQPQPSCVYPSILPHLPASSPPVPPAPPAPMLPTNPALPPLPPLPKWCATCAKSFHGPWFKCDKCLFYIMCPECNDQGQPGEVHRFIYDGSHVMRREDPTPMKQFIPAAPEWRSLTPPAPTLAPEVAATVVTPPTPGPAAPQAASEPVVHVGIVCDTCAKAIVGVRHKCLDCADYDLCTQCMESGSAERHNPFHEFFDIEEPGRVIVHTVFSGNGERDVAPLARNSNGRPTESEVTAPYAPMHEPVTHNAFCDLCDSRITGERYKCLNCPDFDTCASCFSITPDQHPSHGFVRIKTREDIIMRQAVTANSNRHFATCNGCDKTIIGVRYKCMHPSCPDFDLCAQCEALPIPLHPLVHPLLKMKTTDTVVPTVYRAGQSTLIQQPTIPVAFPSCTRSRPPSLPRTPVRVSTPSNVCQSRSPSPLKPIPGALPRSHSVRDIGCDILHNYDNFRGRSPGRSSVLNAYFGITRSSPCNRSPTRTLSRSRSPSLEYRTASPPLSNPHSTNETSLEETAAHVETKTPAPDSSPTHPVSSPSGFRLPPLALDATSDLFREFWPRVAQELRILVQESSTNQPADTDTQLQPTESQVTLAAAAVTNAPGENRKDGPEESPLSQEPLLQSLDQGEPEMSQKNLAPLTNSRSLAALLGYKSPSPISSSALATSVNSLSEKDVTTTNVVLPYPNDIPLGASFLSDNTVPDGQVFPPGAEFVKSWRMLNDGGRPWPDTTELVFVAGERLVRGEGLPQRIKVGGVPQGQEVDVWTGDLKAPDSTGRYVSYWRLSDGLGHYFGHSIWIDISVADLGHCSDGSSDENSLASSSIVMPQSAPVRSTAPSDTAVNNQASSVVSTSPVTHASKLTTDEAASDVGSDGSSVSLISVPSSEEEDEAFYEDSRSHLAVAYPDRVRPGMEYVVLYDENSSEEE